MKSLIFCLIVFFVLILQPANKKPIGFLTKVKGKVIIVNNITKKEIIAKMGTKIYHHFSIQTQKDALTKIVLKNGNIINLGENSFIEIEKIIRGKDDGPIDTSIKLFYGKVRSIMKKDKNRKFSIKTPAAVMGVRGTDFFATFDRNFRTRSSTSSVFTISGKVSLKRINDPDKNEVLVLPGNFSNVQVLEDGSITKPTKPQLTPPQKIHELERNIFPISVKELSTSTNKSTYLNFLDESLKNIVYEEVLDAKPEISQTDLTDDKKVNQVDSKNTLSVASLREKPLIEKAGPNKSSENTSIAASSLNSHKIEMKENPSLNRQNEKVTVKTLKEEKEQISDSNTRLISHDLRFDMSTLSQFSEWMIIQDILDKQENKSYVRFIRHSDVSTDKKKLTKLSTLNAIFYDFDKKKIKKAAPSKKVKKINARAFTKDNVFKGYEIEFLASPGTYYVSIDNGPVSKITVPEKKDITIKTSVFLSPGSDYEIYDPEFERLMPLRDKGNPVFVFPNTYKVLKSIKTQKGVYTGKKRARSFKIEPNSLLSPKF